MKWVTFISLAFLLSFTAAKQLPRKYRHAESHGNLVHHYTTVGDENFHALALVLFSQYAQHATYDEAKKLTTDVVELAKKCAADEQSDPECAKPLGTIFLDELCHEAGLADRLGFTDCCAKAGQERNECFLAHKNDTRGFVPPFQKPDPEVGCKAFHDDSRNVLGQHLYEISRRSPMAPVPLLVAATKAYKKVLETCCQAEDKNACFQEKAPAVKRKVMEGIFMQKYSCYILKKQGARTLAALKLCQLSQKFPKAEFAALEKLAKDVTHVHEEICKGDTLENLLDRGEVTNYICDNQDHVSTNLKGCCDGPLLERTACFLALEHDEKPADLSPTVREFVDNKEHVCRLYAERGDTYLAKFLYEYSRRHDELSCQLLLRLGKGYHDLLDKCCQAETADDCLLGGEEELKKHVAETQAVGKANCDLHDKLGDYKFKNELLVRLTKKAPQLSYKELDDHAQHLADVAHKCCELPENKRLACAEERVDYVFAALCMEHEKHHVNPQVCKCCNSTYAFRGECFRNLGVDPTYQPVPFALELHDNLCSAKQEDQERAKQKLLVGLVKHKPSVTEEQLQAVGAEFLGVVGKCCQAENHEECFTAEGPKLTERAEALLGEN